MSFDIKKGLKIKELYIKKFKVLRNFKISFCDKSDNPLPIIVIAGVNGTGKTTILDSLYDIDLNKNNNMFTSNFGMEKITRDINIDILINGKNKTMRGAVNMALSPNLTELSEEENYINQHINYFFIGNNFFEKFKDYIPNYIEELLFERDVKASNLYQEISDYMTKIFKDMDILVTFDRMDKYKKLYFKNFRGDSFSIDDISTGEKTLVEKILLIYLMNIKDSVILIDEPELSLHPTWQSRVLKLYENFAIENNCQIIIATHSPQIIASAKPEYLRVLTLDKEKNIRVLDNFTKSYGLEFQKVLLEIMGVKELRVPEIEEKFNKLKEYIHDKNSQKFTELFNELETILGSDDTDLQLLKLQANLKGLNV